MVKEPGHGKAPAPARQQQPERPPRVAISKWIGAGVPRQEGGTQYKAFFKNKQVWDARKPCWHFPLQSFILSCFPGRLVLVARYRLSIDPSMH